MFKKITMGQRLVLGSILIIVLYVAFSVIFINTEKSIETLNHEVENVEHHLTDALKLEVYQLNIERIITAFALNTNDKSHIPEIAEEVKKRDGIVSKLEASNNSTQESILIQNVKKYVQELNSSRIEILNEISDDAEFETIFELVETREVKFDSIKLEFNALTDYYSTQLEDIEDERDDVFSNAISTAIMMTVLGAALIAGIFFLIYKGTVPVIRRAVREMNASIAQLSASAQQVSAASQQNSSVAEQVASGSLQQSKQSEEVSNQVSEIAAASQEMSSVAQEVSSTAIQTSQISQEVGQSTEKISDVVNTITNIAEQTNLLALNAAIEAARAGDAGRGFAVVADEVRKLAEESASAAAGIQKTIQTVVSQMRDNVTASSNVSEKIGELSSGVQEQAQVVQKIARTMDSIAAVSEQNSAASQQLSASTQQTSAANQQVAATAQQLQSLASTFEAMVGKIKALGSMVTKGKTVKVVSKK